MPVFLAIMIPYYVYRMRKIGKRDGWWRWW